MTEIFISLMFASIGFLYIRDVFCEKRKIDRMIKNLDKLIEIIDKHIEKEQE